MKQSEVTVSRSTLKMKGKLSFSESTSGSDITVVEDTTKQPSAEQMQKQSDRPKGIYRRSKQEVRYADALKRNLSHASSNKSGMSTAQAMQKIGVGLVKMEHKLKRQSWCPLLYLIVLPAYTLFGGIIFQAVEGPNDDRLIEEFGRYCVEERNNATVGLRSLMMGEGVNMTIAEMFVAANATIMAVDECIRQKHPHTILSMSSLSNAMRYATTIYTTLGYGNMFPKTVGGRLLTMFYAMAGIPIFLAFTTDWGLVLSNLLTWISGFVGSRLRRWRTTTKNDFEEGNLQQANVGPRKKPLGASMRVTTMKGGTAGVQAFENESPSDNNHIRELRRFLIIMVLFIFYFLVVSAVVQALELNEKWSYMDALHFIFTSVALIGFGDLHPENNLVFLCFELPLICLGTILIAMAYYFMQEGIRTIPAKAQRSFKYISVRTGRNKTADAASQHSVEIDEGEPVTTAPPSATTEMTAYLPVLVDVRHARFDSITDVEPKQS